MPKLLIIKGIIFYIASQDIFESRRHIHIESKKGKFRTNAKVWLEPEIETAKLGNFSEIEMNKILKLIQKNLGSINKQLDIFESDPSKIKTIIIK